MQAVCATIVILGNISTIQPEHALGANELRSGGLLTHAFCQDRSVTIFGCTGMQCQQDFDVLHIVLRQREHITCIVGIFCQIFQNRTTAEFGNLHQFIDFGTAVGSHASITGDITPGIKRTAVIHGNGGTGIHLDLTIFTGNRTAFVRLSAFCTNAFTCSVLCTNTYGTVDCDVRTVCHCQLAVQRRCCVILCNRKNAT